MAHLFDPLRLRGIELRNRIVVSPMCQYSSEDGFANDWHFVHLGSRAVGGAALVFTEAAAVTPEGRITPADLGIYKDEHVDMLRRIFRFVTDHGAIAGVQLAHAGRKASTNEPWKGGTPISETEGGWRPIYAASPVPFDEGWQVPQAADHATIARVVRAFADAAVRAREAGARVIEIHAAHGYLLHSFLSPLSNRRKDEYGGTLENRTRMVCEVVAAVREVWPEENPVFLRISATDWVEGGWTPEDSVALARMVAPMGVDVVDCSSGGNVPRARIPVGPGYQVAFAERIKKEAGVCTAAVGMITDAPQAEQIVCTAQADLVLLAREFLRNPYWPLAAAHALHHDAEWPKQYARAKLR
jgi:2,4-dienoyl-CoA reductase-like NADH-dependent reductase (Old Yellow Enzyme family)